MTTGNRQGGDIRRTIAAGPGALGEAAAAAAAFAAMNGIEGDGVARLAIIVEELVANLIEHAALPEAGPIMLELARTGDEVLLVLEDGGAPFDPRRAPLPAGLPPARGGGAGLAIVRAWSHIASYARVGDRNRLVLTMALPRG